MRWFVYTVLALFISQPGWAFSDEFDPGFQARGETQCQSTSPEMSRWFLSRSNNFSPLDQQIGPPRSQGQIGWCYAYAAADMLSHHLNKHVSAMQIVQGFYQESTLGGFAKFFNIKEGGFISSALKGSAGANLCLEEDFPTIRDYDAAMGVRCERPSVQVGNLSVRTEPTSLKKGYKLFKSLDRELAKQKLVGIHYRAAVALPDMISGGSGWADHASTLVARFWNPRTRTCDYLLRNTWGTGCHSSNCHFGYYRVPEELLSDSIQEIIYIK